MTENDKKKDKQDKETEICFYSPFLQSTEELIKDRNMNIIFCNQYAWTNSIWTDRWQLETIAPTPNIENSETDFIAQNIDGTVIISFNNNDRHTNRLIEVLNDTFTPFIVFLNSHITDILIKEALTDSPLFIIKEKVNCGNFLNNDIFTLLTDKINRFSY